jgi:hypothetical protein
MMANWTKILPFFMVKYYAERNCEIFERNGEEFVRVYENIYIMSARQPG